MRRLAQEYAAAVDAGDVAGLLELFLPDAELTVLRPGGEREHYAGHAQLPRLFERLRECEATLHEVANHRVRLDGDEGEGEAGCVAHHILTGGEPRDLVLCGRYHDRYRRQDGRWRFAGRCLLVAWSELRPVRLG